MTQMLTPCVQCGTKSYTEESPLWYHCPKCLKPKKSKLHCDGCQNEYPRTHLVYNGEGRYCDRCYKSPVIVICTTVTDAVKII
jgi:hypothetical protein